MIGLFLTLLLVLIVVAMVYWIVTLIPLPPPGRNIALAILLLIALIYVVGLLFGQVPVIRYRP